MLTVAQVASLLGISRATAYRLVGEGGLPHLRISNAVRVHPEALQRWLEGTATKGA